MSDCSFHCERVSGKRSRVLPRCQCLLYSLTPHIACYCLPAHCIANKWHCKFLTHVHIPTVHMEGDSLHPLHLYTRCRKKCLHITPTIIAPVCIYTILTRPYGQCHSWIIHVSTIPLLLHMFVAMRMHFSMLTCYRYAASCKHTWT